MGRQASAEDAASATRLVFIDETGTNAKMTRLRRRSPKGQRLKARAPFGHWKTQTFIAGLRCHGLTAPFVVDAPMNRRIFETYVTTQLAPRSKRATSSFSTTSPPIEALWPRRPSEPAAHGSCSCRPTAPTSIQSKWHSPSSRRICAEQSGPSTPSRAAIGDICQLSHPPNAEDYFRDRRI